MIGSLFSGIGGLELGLERAGLGPTIWQVEIDPKARAILARHWPSTLLLEDVREVCPTGLTKPDLICGGFPCQDISSANYNRRGLSGEKSGLWVHFHRIVEALQPSWVVVENVASGWKKWVSVVRSDLHGIGYSSMPIRVCAADVGARHRRCRVFIVANLDSDGKLQPERCVENIWRWASNCRWWADEPDVARVVHGLSGRLDRERFLGNAVVPQVAEAVGHGILACLGGN